MLRNRLFAIGVLMFAAQIAVLVFYGGIVLPLCVCAAAAAFSFIAAKNILTMRTALAFSLIPVFAFLYFSAYSSLFMKKNSIFTGSVTGKVCEVTEGSWGESVVVKSLYSDYDIKSGAKIKVYIDPERGEAPFDIGDLVTVSGVFRPSAGKPKLLAYGIDFYTNGNAVKIGGTDNILNSLRKKIITNAEARLGKSGGAFFKAVTLGEGGAVDEEDRIVYSRAGVSHILAVSGLHLSILVSSVYFALRQFIRKRVLLSVILSLFAFAYAALTGFSPSAVRAVIMLVIFFAGQALKRESDGVTSLFAALFILLVFNPFLIASLSLQLSFLATLGILAVSDFAGRYSAKTSLKRRLWAVALPVIYFGGAFLFTLPITSLAFDEVSVFGILTNAAVGVCFTVLLTLSFVFALLTVIFAPLAVPIAFLLKYGIAFFRLLCGTVAGLPFSTFSAFSPYIKAASAVCLVFISASLFLKRGQKKVLFILAACGVTISFAAMGVSGFHAKNSGAVISYTQTRKGYAATVFSGGEGVLLDFGCGAQAEKIVYRSGETSCSALVYQNFDGLDPKTAKNVIKRMDIKKLYLKNPQNEMERGLLEEIKGVAAGCGCVVLTYDSLTLEVGFAVVFIEPESGTVKVSSYGKTYLLLASGDGDIPAVSADMAIIPAGVSPSKTGFDFSAATLICAEDIYFEEDFPPQNILEYSYYDIITIKIPSNAKSEVGIWRDSD